LEILVAVCEPEAPSDRSVEVSHRNLALRALAKFPLLAADAARIIGRAGLLVRPLQELSQLELQLLGRALVGVPDRAEGLVRQLWELGLLVQMLDVLPPVFMLHAATLFFEGTEPKNMGDVVRFARFIENALCSEQCAVDEGFLSRVRPWL